MVSHQTDSGESLDRWWGGVHHVDIKDMFGQCSGLEENQEKLFMMCPSELFEIDCDVNKSNRSIHVYMTSVIFKQFRS